MFVLAGSWTRVSERMLWSLLLLERFSGYVMEDARYGGDRRRPRVRFQLLIFTPYSDARPVARRVRCDGRGGNRDCWHPNSGRTARAGELLTLFSRWVPLSGAGDTMVELVTMLWSCCL